jgi:2-oxo-4-hydroxy-4-carboxy--5-ureidoimidazoline (OHCU) decarboxylase
MPVNNALTPEGSNALGAAFGYYPQLKKYRQFNDPSASSEMPLQFMRGRLAGTVGLPSDVLNMFRSPNPMEVYGQTDYAPQQQVPYGSQELMRTLPLAPTSPAGQLAGNVGSVVPLSPAEILQSARVARQAALAGGKVGKSLGKYAGEEFNATLLGERPNTMLGAITPQPKFIFVGENSKTWNKANANQALEMEKAGAKPEDIWATTGTFRGPEGKLRQEISDLPAVFREDQLPQAPSVLSVATQYLRDKGVITNPNRDIASIGVPEELRKEAIDFATTKLQQMEQPKTLLGNVFEHPELLQAYPDLANIKVGKETSANYRGMFNPEKNTITTGGGLIGGSTDQSRSTMLHELQHAIQETEGMAKGGNPKAMPNIIRKQWSEELEPLQEANSKFRGNLMRLQAASGQQYLNSLDKLSVADNIKPSQVFRFSDWYKYSGDIHDALGKMPTRKSFARDEWLRRASQIMRQKVVEDRPSLLDYKMDEREANNLYRAASRGLDKTRKEAQAFDTIQRKYQELYKMPNEESYMHLAGEAEARATQERLGLNELERLTKFPYESYDRPKNKLLITK